MRNEKGWALTEMDRLIHFGEDEIIPTKYSKTDRHGRVAEYVDSKGYASWRTSVLSLLETLLKESDHCLRDLRHMDTHHLGNAETIIALLSDVKAGIADGSVAPDRDASLGDDML
ncbi:MAG: hypothetical protein LBL63_00250, partial [Clostridiales Family XIII bacterium]|nr:hypothetical protein [Clostridiales Family XIII bacterium]